MKPPSKLRCGCRLYNGVEIPIEAEVKIHQGRECYLSGIDDNCRIIKYLDTGEIKRFKIK